MDNVTELKPSSHTHEFEFLSKRTTLSFDERYLYEEWKKGITKGRSTYLLHRLSPIVVEETTHDKDSLKIIRMSWILIIASIVVYFSDYNSKIPLLAPVLIGFGIILIGVNIRKTWPRDWVLVYDDYNYKQVGIPTSDNESETTKIERQKFLNKLSEAIDVAKKKEFYD